MEDLFDRDHEAALRREAPLAERMRPQTLAEFVGQNDVVGKDKLLRRAIESGEPFSMILWGPPGCGKTTLARLIATATKSAFVQFSAVMTGVGDLKNVIAEAQKRRKFHQQKTILFLDEIHRWNKAQQDALLPHVENGAIVLVGATTENPSFEIISPLLSRSRVYVLQRLDDRTLATLVRRALTDVDRGLGALKKTLDVKALRFLVDNANGDARIALNTLEVAAQAAKTGAVTVKHIEEALQRPALLYDKAGEEHFNVISAFIKSLRGSDPDAGLYWLARMLEAGENARFIARRMVILASEDIGNADPQALVLAVAAAQAVELVGLPEAQLNLAQAVTYLATAPKSNASYVGLLRAKADVTATLNMPVPLHLRNAVTDLMKGIGYGKGYKYSHDFTPGSTAAHQAYRPKELEGHVYYEPRSSNQKHPTP